MKRTPLYDEHVKLGAKIVNFNNWEMPVQYTSVIDEHNTTRTKVGLFDICHMGEFLIEGKDSVQFLQKILAKDISKLEQGKCIYTVMCDEKGSTVDDLFVYKFKENKFMLVTNASTIEKDLKHLVANRKEMDTTISNISNDMAKLDIQGPKAKEIMENALNIDLSELKRFEFKDRVINKIYFIISRSGYTGEDGFEMYFNSEKASEIWNLLLEKGKEQGIKPIGLGARDTLRLECCYSLYGHELNEKINPIEAGISFAVSLNKEGFIGKEALENIKNNQKNKIVAFELLEKGIPRHGYKVLKDNKEIGHVTSGTLSPTLKKGIGLALININYAELETEIDINIRDKLYKAKIIKKPFYNYNGK